jgi:hypothetical protein
MAPHKDNGMLLSPYISCSYVNHVVGVKRKAEDHSSPSDKKRLKSSHSSSPDPGKQLKGLKPKVNPIPFPEKVITYAHQIVTCAKI